MAVENYITNEIKCTSPIRKFWNIFAQTKSNNKRKTTQILKKKYLENKDCVLNYIVILA